MTFLTIPALLLAVTAQAPVTPVSSCSVGGPFAGHPGYRPCTPPLAYRPYTPPPTYRPYTPPPAYRPYTPPPAYRPNYRTYRRSPSHRERLFADDYLKNGGTTFTIRGGYHDLTGEPGAFKLLQPRGSFGYGFGWNISPFVHLGLGVDGFIYGQQGGKLGPVKGISQINVLTDLTFRLIRPSERRYVVPFLQVGMGLSFLTGSVQKTESTVGADGTPETTTTSNSVNLARGGLFQAGGGLEIFLTRFLSISVRALYRAQPMSGMRCLEGAACDPATGPSQVTLHGLAADAALTVHFMSL